MKVPNNLFSMCQMPWQWVLYTANISIQSQEDWNFNRVTHMMTGEVKHKDLDWSPWGLQSQFMKISKIQVILTYCFHYDNSFFIKLFIKSVNKYLKGNYFYLMLLLHGSKCHSPPPPIFPGTEGPVGRNQLTHLPKPFLMTVHLSDLLYKTHSDGDSAVSLVNHHFIWNVRKKGWASLRQTWVHRRLPVLYEYCLIFHSHWHLSYIFQTKSI